MFLWNFGDQCSSSALGTPIFLLHSALFTLISNMLSLTFCLNNLYRILSNPILKITINNFFRELCDAWECISRERALFPSLIDYILELMFESFVHPYDVSFQSFVPGVCTHNFNLACGNWRRYIGESMQLEAISLCISFDGIVKGSN